MSPSLPYDEQSLFAQMANGDHAAFTHLFHYYNARLFPFVERITKSSAISEDIVQEAFMRLWLNREKLSTYEKPGAWLFLVASNLALTHLRNAAGEAIKHKNVYVNHLPHDTVSPSKELEGKEMALFVEEAIMQLPSKRQLIFRLSRQNGMTHRQIADKLSISPNTVKDHLVIAMKFIREYLQQKTGFSVGVLLLTKFL